MFRSEFTSDRTRPNSSRCTRGRGTGRHEDDGGCRIVLLSRSRDERFLSRSLERASDSRRHRFYPTATSAGSQRQVPPRQLVTGGERAGGGRADDEKDGKSRRLMVEMRVINNRNCRYVFAQCGPPLSPAPASATKKSPAAAALTCILKKRRSFLVREIRRILPLSPSPCGRKISPARGGGGRRGGKRIGCVGCYIAALLHRACNEMSMDARIHEDFGLIPRAGGRPDLERWCTECAPVFVSSSKLELKPLRRAFRHSIK